ncbi:hypothetical protein SmJEL517_g03356 [Synchytrium microbalum]|uniref:Rho-GAP domain-containing protein n=1 Tax=Synchytrium microbalum TaxID=1806994 RepID=A0A507C346_9FUNG|nr:uncharacterized protein SmJEL517_g03356 [Synchytrium microbalum]TPX33871.1 hypothetical protein SmJEL517_g03356 [Synchytrium microbalum]
MPGEHISSDIHGLTPQMDGRLNMHNAASAASPQGGSSFAESSPIHSASTNSLQGFLPPSNFVVIPTTLKGKTSHQKHQAEAAYYQNLPSRPSTQQHEAVRIGIGVFRTANSADAIEKRRVSDPDRQNLGVANLARDTITSAKLRIRQSVAGRDHTRDDSFKRESVPKPAEYMPEDAEPTTTESREVESENRDTHTGRRHRKQHHHMKDNDKVVTETESNGPLRSDRKHRSMHVKIDVKPEVESSPETAEIQEPQAIDHADERDPNMVHDEFAQDVADLLQTESVPTSPRRSKYEQRQPASNPWRLTEHDVQHSALSILVSQKMQQMETGTPIVTRPLPAGTMLTTNPIKIYYAIPTSYAGQTFDRRIGSSQERERARTPSPRGRKRGPPSPTSRQRTTQIGQVEALSADKLRMPENASRISLNERAASPDTQHSNGHHALHQSQHLVEKTVEMPRITHSDRLRHSTSATASDALPLSRPQDHQLSHAPTPTLKFSERRILQDNLSDMKIMKTDVKDGLVLEQKPSKRGHSSSRAQSSSGMQSDIENHLASPVAASPAIVPDTISEIMPKSTRRLSRHRQELVSNDEVSKDPIQSKFPKADDERGRPLSRGSQRSTASDVVALDSEYTTHSKPHKEGDSISNIPPNFGKRKSMSNPLSEDKPVSRPVSRGVDSSTEIPLKAKEVETTPLLSRPNSRGQDVTVPARPASRGADATFTTQMAPERPVSRGTDVTFATQMVVERPVSRGAGETTSRPPSRLHERPPSRGEEVRFEMPASPDAEPKVRDKKDSHWTASTVTSRDDRRRSQAAVAAMSPPRTPRQLTPTEKTHPSRMSRSFSPPSHRPSTTGAPLQHSLAAHLRERRRTMSANPNEKELTKPAAPFQFQPPKSNNLRTNVITKPKVAVISPFLPPELSAAPPKVRVPPATKKAAEKSTTAFSLRIAPAREMHPLPQVQAPEGPLLKVEVDAPGGLAPDVPKAVRGKPLDAKRRQSMAPKPMPTWRPGGVGDPIKRNEFLRNREFQYFVAVYQAMTCPLRNVANLGERAKQIAQLLRTKLFANDSDSDSDDDSEEEEEQQFFPSNLPKFTGDRETIISRIEETIDHEEEEPEENEEQHSSQYYKLIFLNDFVQLEARDSDMRDNQRAFIIRDTSIVPTKMITRLTEEDAAKFCYHMYRYIRSVVENIIPGNITLDILRVAEESEDDEAIAASLKRIISKVPRSEYLLLKAIFSHLQRISSLCDIDIVRNLGVVFGPVIFRVTTDGQIPGDSVHGANHRHHHHHHHHHNNASLANGIQRAAAMLGAEGQALASLFEHDFASDNMNATIMSETASEFTRPGFFDVELSTVDGSEAGDRIAAMRPPPPSKRGGPPPVSRPPMGSSSGGGLGPPMNRAARTSVAIMDDMDEYGRQFLEAIQSATQKAAAAPAIEEESEDFDDDEEDSPPPQPTSDEDNKPSDPNDIFDFAAFKERSLTKAIFVDSTASTAIAAATEVIIRRVDAIFGYNVHSDQQKQRKR